MCHTLVCKRNFFNDDILKWQDWSSSYDTQHKNLDFDPKCGSDNGLACYYCLER